MAKVLELRWRMVGRSGDLRCLVEKPAKIVFAFRSDGMKVEKVQRGMYCCLIEKHSMTGLGMLSYSAGQSHDVRDGESRIGSESALPTTFESGEREVGQTTGTRVMTKLRRDQRTD